MDDLRYWIGFNLVKGIGSAKLQALRDHFSSLEEAWQADEGSLREIGIDQRTIHSFMAARLALNLEREEEKLAKQEVRVLCWDSADYPTALRSIPNSPPVLYVRGQLQPQDSLGVAIVGTRKLTSYGKQVAHDLALGLAESGITVVSGLAKGIDAIAHKTTLEQGGRTVGVLGSGLDCIYPVDHTPLVKGIVAGHGAVVSEYGLGVHPEAKNFPPRNRIISGLSLGVIVVEAAEQSGALITADFAREQGRELFAVPGNISSWSSRGTNALIQQGAKLVMGVDDVLSELNLSRKEAQVAVQLALPESAEEAALLAHLSQQPLHIDELSRQTQLPIALVSSTLTLMELKGAVRQVGGMQYVLK